MQRPTLQPTLRPAEIPLSYVQRRLWFLNRLEGRSGTYNVPVILRLKGRLEVAALEAALGDVMERHESLRTVFPESLGVPRQEVVEASRAQLQMQVKEVTEGGW